MPMIAKAAAAQKKKGPKEKMEPKAEEKKEAKMPESCFSRIQKYI